MPEALSRETSDRSGRLPDRWITCRRAVLVSAHDAAVRPARLAPLVGADRAAGAALLYALAFLFMPFSVIGVKGRLDVIEARLDEIQGEIRHLALRLPEVGRAADYDEIYAPEPTVQPRRAAAGGDPPADPAGLARAGRRTAARAAGTRRAARTGSAAGRGGRSEPRLDWPR